MTPEERFTKIENLLAFLTDRQVQNEAEIDKHNAAIRDLIAVSRTLVNSQKETTTQIQALTSDIAQMREAHKKLGDELREAQKITEDKLHALIDTVDRIIRSREK
jgi:hypothetical protein